MRGDEGSRRLRVTVRQHRASGTGDHKRLVHELGYSSAAQAESFYVEGVTGPLLEGELDRAHAWGEMLGNRAIPALERTES